MLLVSFKFRQIIIYAGRKEKAFYYVYALALVIIVFSKNCRSDHKFEPAYTNKKTAHVCVLELYFNNHAPVAIELFFV